MKKVSFLSVFVLLLAWSQADAQQGKYVNSSAARMVKLIDQANGAGYKLQNDGFSIGGGWLKQGRDHWVPIFTTALKAGQDYRLIAVGDMDAKDVDIQILNEAGQIVASDTAASPEAIVNFRPSATGRYTIRLRLYSSQGDVPAVCMCILMTR